MEDYSDNEDLYNFDITPAKSQQKRRKSQQEKREEQEERRRILSKTKEERLEELLGEIHSQGAAELELERQQQREREAEEARLREEEKESQRKAALMRAEEARTKQLLAQFSFSSDSLNTGSASSVSPTKAECVSEMVEEQKEEEMNGREVEDEGGLEGELLKRYSFADMSEMLQQQSSQPDGGLRLSPINQSSSTVSEREKQSVNETYENDFVSDVQDDTTDTTPRGILSVEQTESNPPEVAKAVERQEESAITYGAAEVGGGEAVEAVPSELEHETQDCSPAAPALTPQSDPAQDLPKLVVAESVQATNTKSDPPMAKQDGAPLGTEQPSSSPSAEVKDGGSSEHDATNEEDDAEDSPEENAAATPDAETTGSTVQDREELEAKRLFWEGMKQRESPSHSPLGMTPPPPPPESKPTFAYLQTPPPPPPSSIKSKLTGQKKAQRRNAGLELTIQELQQREDGLLHQVHPLERDKELLQKEVKEFKSKLAQSDAELYALKTKLTEVQGMSKARVALESVVDKNQKEGNLSASELSALKKEIEEQERLLQGYQKENEKLVQELRVKDQESLLMKQTLYKENKRLGRELNNTPAKPQGNAQSLRRKLEVEQQLERLQEELETSCAKQQELKSELAKAKRDKREVESRKGAPPSSSSGRVIDELRKELAEARYEHLAEAKKLKEKLAWYAENQSIISENDALIAEQKNLIEKLRGETHTSKRRSKSLLSDIKRIRALENQVKDLEEALQKRNPDSLSNLIRAAGPSTEEQRAKKLLEAKVKSLEEELKERSEATTRRTRAMRQEHEKVKLHYEQMLRAKVEAGQLEKNPANANRQLTRARIVALEEELERVRNFYRLKLEGLSKKQSQATKGPRASDAQSQREIDRFRAKATALEVKVEELESELALVRQPASGKQARTTSCTVKPLELLPTQTKSAESSTVDVQLKELKAKLSEREEHVKHLTQQLEESMHDKDVAKENRFRRNSDASSLETFLEQKIRESDRYRSMYESLQKETETLRMEKEHMAAELKELRRAKIHENPGMLQHQSLLHRIEEMELRHTNRQRELEVIIEQLKQKADLDMQLVKSKHENELLKKDAQINEFQTELNAIIDQLQHVPH